MVTRNSFSMNITFFGFKFVEMICVLLSTDWSNDLDSSYGLHNFVDAVLHSFNHNAVPGSKFHAEAQLLFHHALYQFVCISKFIDQSIHLCDYEHQISKWVYACTQTLLLHQ